jgi:hypothetical protein
MTRINLDAIEEWAQMEPPESWGRRNVPALVAELRAAREVIKAGYLHRRSMERPGFSTCSCYVCCALIDYDQAVGS